MDISRRSTKVGYAIKRKTDEGEWETWPMEPWISFYSFDAAYQYAVDGLGFSKKLTWIFGWIPWFTDKWTIVEVRRLSE